MTDTTTSNGKDTEWSMCELLRKRYAEPAFVVIRQVRNKAAFDATNTADAFAMGVWPSRGLHLHGFEIKVSRSDWLKELAQPWKADAFQPHCDYWWVVTSPGVVQLGELPESWGHLERRGQRLVCVKEAPKNAEPEAISRSMLAAIVKRQGDPDRAALAAAEEKGSKLGAKAAEQGFEFERSQFTKLKEKVRAFETASGISLEHGWHDGDKMGKAVAQVLRGNPMDRAIYQRDNLAKIVEDLTALIEAKS
jgi:hypothetical protein